MPGLFCHTAFFPADRDRCRDSSQSQEHHGKGTLHTIVVPGLRRGRSDRQDFNTSLLKPADRAFLMLAAAFGCRSAYDCIMQRQRAGGSVIESIPSGIGTIRTGSACAVC